MCVAYIIWWLVQGGITDSRYRINCCHRQISHRIHSIPACLPPFLTTSLHAYCGMARGQLCRCRRHRPCYHGTRRVVPRREHQPESGERDSSRRIAFVDGDVTALAKMKLDARCHFRLVFSAWHRASNFMVARAMASPSTKTIRRDSSRLPYSGWCSLRGTTRRVP